MSVNPDIHDKAYQFFIEEATELLQIIEDGILELRRDRGANTVHAVMRAAHSIKGGAASVELESIKTIAHRMETAFRALYDETVEIDDELEGLLLDGFDCLKEPLNEQIETGSHDPEAALSVAMPIIEALEEKIGADALKQADNYIPSSSDLGIDMVTSIFEIDVEEGIAHLEEVAANPANFPVLGELQAQAEVFIGFGELLELPGFGAISQAILDACHNSPADPIGLLTIALQDLQAAKALVMGGDRDQGGAPSEALLALAGGSSRDAGANDANGTASDATVLGQGLSAGDFADFGISEADLANFDFGAADLGNADPGNVNLIETSGGEDFAALEDLSVLEAASRESGEQLGDSLAELAVEPAIETEALNANVTDSEADDLALGVDDFQALIDESASLGFAGADAVVNNEAVEVQASDFLAEPSEAVDNHLSVLEASEAIADDGSADADAAAFDSLDAMAQLADLMAAPDAEAAISDVATAESSEEGLGIEQPAEGVEAIAPDAELESMWTELEGIGTEPAEAEVGEPHNRELDTAFEIAMDQASMDLPVIAPTGEPIEQFIDSVEQPEAEQPEAEQLALEQLAVDANDDESADIFADEVILLTEEQDATMALSAAEADAAFEAMVDASATEQSNADSQVTIDAEPDELLALAFSGDIIADNIGDDNVSDSKDVELGCNEAAGGDADEDSVAEHKADETDASEVDEKPSWDSLIEEQSLAEATSETEQPAQSEFLDPWSSLAAEASVDLEQVAEQQNAFSAAADALNAADSSVEEQADEISEQSSGETAPPVAEELVEELIEEGTFIQGLDMGTLVQAEIPAPTASQHNSDNGVDATEAFEDGTFIQGIDEGTYIQAVLAESAEVANPPELESPELASSELESPELESLDEGTYVQLDEAGTHIQDPSIQNLPGLLENEAIAGDWPTPAEADKAEDEPLIPELQAFIDQAAAESAVPMEKQTEALVSDEAIGTETGDAEALTLESAQSETAEAGDAEPEVAAPEAIESEVNGLEIASSEIRASSTEEAELKAAEPKAERTAEAAAETGLESEVVASQGDAAAPLPSLDTIFSVAPEQLAAIASDSLISEPIDGAGVDAESEPESELKPETESESGVEPDEPAQSEAVTAPGAEKIAPAETPPLTSTAVEVALAEHQLVEPAVTPGEGGQARANRIADAVLAAEELFSQMPMAGSPQGGQTENDQAKNQAQNRQTGGPAPEANPTRANEAGASQAGAPQSSSAQEQPGSKTQETAKSAKKKRQQNAKLSGISVRVDLSVLERMNNLVGELVLSRNSLSLQHEQLQSVVTQLDKRFSSFEGQLNGLRGLSDQMLVEPDQRKVNSPAASQASDLTGEKAKSEGEALLEGFDVLEMDRYSALHGQLQEIFEQLMQLEEGVDDIGVLLEQSTQSLTQQRQRLSLLQNELMWARMLPLDNILGRFPRVLRDMARKHGKSVDLNLNGTSVLVDKGMLEKLHDPMLHLLRNAFDHGIEKPDTRKQQGKPERGEIQINAYYQGNQTVIEIKDDGQGINLERIAKRAIELQWLSRDEIKSVPQQALLDLIFEPGFSTAAKLSELSGRGVGLDVVREQIKGLKGNVTVDFEPGQGTTFTLRLPLTLTVAKLMVCQVGTTAIALPSDGIEDLLVPQPEQLKTVGDKRLLYWRDELIPIQPMADLLDYSCPTADIASLKNITAKSIPVPQDWALPLLIFSRGSQRCAMEVNRLLMEQELVIKPFSSAMTPPDYSYGCTILGDGRMIPVLDGTALLQQLSHNSVAMAAGVDLDDDALGSDLGNSEDTVATVAQAMQAETLLVVDDSTAMRRTMALSLEKAGYRVLQAGDGQEALTQLRQSSAIQLVICDVEMPNMNGFEFLSQRRREPALMKIPVVMLTSRSSDKHRRLAMQLKAHDYFSKPYVEQDFIKSIKQILSTQKGAVAKV